MKRTKTAKPALITHGPNNLTKLLITLPLGVRERLHKMSAAHKVAQVAIIRAGIEYWLTKLEAEASTGNGTAKKTRARSRYEMKVTI